MDLLHVCIKIHLHFLHLHTLAHSVSVHAQSATELVAGILQQYVSMFLRWKQIKIPLHRGSTPLAPWFNKTFQMSLKASWWKVNSYILFFLHFWNRIIDHNVRLCTLDFLEKTQLDSSLSLKTEIKSSRIYFTIFSYCEGCISPRTWKMLCALELCVWALSTKMSISPVSSSTQLLQLVSLKFGLQQGHVLVRDCE